MLLNLPSRIIINLVFSDLERFLKSLFGCNSIAVSPILEHATGLQVFRHAAVIERAGREITVLISYDDFTDEEVVACGQYLGENLDYTGAVVKLLFKKKISARFYEPAKYTAVSSTNYEITVSIRTGSRNCMMHLAVPSDLFKLLLPSINESVPASDIEKGITEYFKNAALLVPDVRTILESLDTRELGILFNRLQAGNLLTNYQLLLLIIAFPDLSLKIKKCISQNTIDDVIILKKNIGKYRINKRDIIGCLYSIEEAIFMLIKSGFSFRFSRYLSELESTVKNILGMDMLLRKDFISWIEEMSSAGLLYDTISRCSEETIASAISPERKALLPVLGKAVSVKKIDSITVMMKDAEDYASVFESRLKMISTYRSLKLKRTGQTHESLDYLLARFKNDRDYIFVLLTVGWFVLSTALKGVAKNNALRTMKSLPDGARFLMEDILKGTVNPNIIHDDIQVNRAKTLCVKAILALYEDGVIVLDE